MIEGVEIGWVAGVGMPLVLIVVAGSSLGWASSLTCIVALVSKKLQALKQSHHQVYRQIYRQMYRQALHPLRASTVFFQVLTKPLPKYIGNFQGVLLENRKLPRFCGSSARL